MATQVLDRPTSYVSIRILPNPRTASSGGRARNGHLHRTTCTGKAIKSYMCAPWQTSRCSLGTQRKIVIPHLITLLTAIRFSSFGPQPYNALRELSEDRTSF